MCIIISMHSTKFLKINTRLVYLAGGSLKDKEEEEKPKITGCAHIKRIKRSSD